MTLHQTIKEGIKEAMKSKDAIRLSVLRGLLSAFTNELVAKGQKPQEELGDEGAIAVIKRAIKQRKDSIEQFTAGGRKDLADSEESELVILQTFVPVTMSKEEILKIAIAKKEEMGFTDKSKLGVFVGVVMKELKGKADGADVKEVVDGLFV